MASSETGTAVLMERLREFDRVASVLDMPRAERLNILNVSDEVYSSLRNGLTHIGFEVKPELERRLSYALPLMRRLARNTPRPPSGKAASRGLQKV